MDTLLNLIPNLPIDELKPIEVLFREQVKARGLDQNGLYWKIVGEIADQAWFQGKQFDKQVWHEYAARNIMQEEITTKDGEIRSKWVETPDGGMTVISTTQLAKGCFAAYTEEVEAFGASLGVMFKAREYA